jgi:hypothetical protein
MPAIGCFEYRSAASEIPRKTILGMDSALSVLRRGAVEMS